MKRAPLLLIALLILTLPLAERPGPAAAQDDSPALAAATHYPEFGGTDPAPRDAVEPAYGVYNNRETDYRAVNAQRVEAVLRAIEQDTGVAAVALNDWADVVEGSDALQIVNNVPVEGALYTIFLPPSWTRETEMAVLLSGNGAGTSNNARLYGDPDIIPAQVTAFSVRGGRIGLIAAISNCGGTESQGVDEVTLRSVGAFLDFIDENGGDKTNVITAGGSRGGGSALVWGANPLDLDYEVHGVFAAVPPTDYGTLAQRSLLTYPSLAGIVELISHRADAWRYDSDTGWNPAAAARYLDILLGTTDPAEVEARSPIGMAARLAGKQVVLAYGTHDSYFPLGPFLAFDRRLTELDVHHTTIITLAHGHENSDYFMQLLVLYLDGAMQGLKLSVPRGRFYFIDVDPRQDEQVPLGDFLAERDIDADPAELPVIVQLPYRAGVDNPVDVEVCGTPGDEVFLTLTDEAGDIAWDAHLVIDEQECRGGQWVTDHLAPGTYTWALTVNGQVVDPTHTPTRDSNGCGLPAVTIITEEQPQPDDSFAFSHDMGYGLDEFSGQPEFCQSR